MNKYEKWYSGIIENARNRKTDEYTETHHILPRSLGGNNDPTNLVDLTAREHFMCHWLLTKMHTGINRKKMLNAIYIMKGENSYQKRYKTKITARVYEKLRKEYAAYISKLNTGRKQPPEEKAKQLAAQIGRKRAPFSQEWKEKLSAAKRGKNNNRYGVTVSEETRKKIGDKLRGKKQDPARVAARAEKQRSLNMKREKKLCPHCNREVAVNGYARWHGDNCKEKK